MTTAVQRLMSSYEALSKAEQQQVVAEILRRMPIEDDDISDQGLSEIMDELLQTLDADERARS